jgi:predicted enzyme related to lactoylglutathione lyase
MIRWLTAFIDLPASRFDAGVAFWATVTGAALSALRGDHDEFATLVPPDGDAFISVQRVANGPGGIHLDLHVDDLDASADRLRRAGAEVVATLDYVVMRSPAGYTFCLVPPRSASVLASPHHAGAGTSRVDQLAIDVPAAAFEGEVEFWAAATGSAPTPSARYREFTFVARQEGMPLRLLLQRLGPDDARAHATGHLDLAAGTDVAALAAWHVELGAEVVRVTEHWTTLLDPAGLTYCLTARDPLTGIIA